MKINNFRNFLIILLLFATQIACKAQTDSSLIIGNFKISKVTDGDTFRFENLDNSVRLLGIDTEETFKTEDAEQKTNELAQNWEAYYKAERGDSKMPVKADSPFGYEAWKWAEEFLKDADHVRLETEADDRSVDMYGRYLVYMIVIMKDGTEVNYNIECVRLGYSPYFNKYGNSTRFHEAFTEAQEYAKSNSLGIWDPEKKHYPDYEERIVWWNKRAKQIEDFEKNYSGKENYLNLNSDKDFNSLGEYIGQEITVFGGISNIMTKKFPYLLRIPHSKKENFDIVVYEENVGLLNEINIEDKKEYYIFAKGILESYKDGYQIVLKNKDQIWMED
ncbi:MAG: thermonuclease family protein [Ignavibacteria bacterium]|nr:thermonuclease family protein [Ignavibacteriota bacterium]